jgi:hypothetical protein
MSKIYRSAHDLLQQLPPVLSVRDLERMAQTTSQTAANYISRFLDRGLLKPVGPNGKVYFNLVVDRKADVNRREEAAFLLFPSAIVSSLTVLHDEGVITQIPSSLHVAVLSRRSYPKLDNIEVHPRPAGWFRKMRDGHVLPGHPSREDHPGRLPRLTPEAAFVDALKYGDGWISEPDDVDLENLDWQKIDQLAVLLRMDKKVLAPFREVFQETDEMGPR